MNLEQNNYNRMYLFLSHYFPRCLLSLEVNSLFLDTWLNDEFKSGSVVTCSMVARPGESGVPLSLSIQTKCDYVA